VEPNPVFMHRFRPQLADDRAGRKAITLPTTAIATPKAATSVHW
jgi:hypothetical protein